ncbi:WbqC family protein [Pseudonocardia aurantiaca]|uniref:WbqC family protein n=1 Tax=Pseudonocardia aurantiaca TaxID=75290 RepID=A0ABW4FVZ9_9PSEU
MIVAAHQPNFAPWLGFFDKMRHADVLVLLDTVQFVKRGYQNRTRIKGPGGPQWLTVPVVTKGRYDQATHDVEIDESAEWRRVHLRTLQSVLAKAPHRDEVFELMESVYAQPGVHRLVDVAMAIIGEVVKRMEIPTRLVPASELGCEGSGSRLMLNLTRAVGGDVYLSGTTGREYLEPAMFAEAGVGLRYHAFEVFEYPQQHGAFAPGLSCIDYIGNAGFAPWADGGS